jgi:periplasmic mercuric ion binding protein
MKTLQMFLMSFLLISFSFTGFAQEKSETLMVAGECGMCQKKIESAAKAAGASFAAWDPETKALQVKYSDKKTNNEKIQQAIAKVGYDTESFKATDEAYDKLHGCCKYDRSASPVKYASSKEGHSCGNDKNCDHSNCHKDGKCSPDMACCKEGKCDKKEGGCDKKDCSKKG